MHQTTANRRDPKRAKTQQVSVSFGSVTITDKIAVLPIAISRLQLTLEEADRLLCGRQLTASILARPEGAQSTQEALPGLEGEGDVELLNVFDVARFNVTPTRFKASLIFRLKEVDMDNTAISPTAKGCRKSPR